MSLLRCPAQESMLIRMLAQVVGAHFAPASFDVFAFSILSMFLTFDVSIPGVASGGIRPGSAMCSGQVEDVSIALLTQFSFG